MAKYDIFISYSRHDFNTVIIWKERLEADGYNVWIDIDGIESGDAFKRNIVNAIESSSVVIFFSSKYSNLSAWTVKEIGIAINENKPIIPILLDNAKYDDEIRFDLINLDFIDAKRCTIFEQSYAKLSKALKSKWLNNKHCTDAKEELVNRNYQSKEIQKEIPENIPPQRKETIITDSSIPENYDSLRTNRSDKSNKQISFIAGLNKPANKKYILIFLICLISCVLFSIFFIYLPDSDSHDTTSSLFPSGYFEDKTVEDIFNTAEAYYKDGQYDHSKYAYALELYKAAADSGYVIAQYKVGYLYHHMSEYPNFTEAAKWYQKAADNGNVEAMKILAYWYKVGVEDAVRDYPKVVELYRKAANFGDGESAHALACMYLSGEGVSKNSKLGLLWLMKADSLGYGLASKHLGDIYFNGEDNEQKDTIKALNYYERASNSGIGTATLFLARRNRYGNGVRKNTDEAIRFYNLAINQECTEAAMELGEMYYYGENVKQDKEKAFELFQTRDLFKTFKIYPLIDYATYYDKGINGRKKDLKLAYELYKIGASVFSSKECMFKVGEFLENGKGVPRNMEEAIKWYEKATENGSKEAKERLTIINEEGK